jgi:hypothetical protein
MGADSLVGSIDFIVRELSTSLAGVTSVARRVERASAAFDQRTSDFAYLDPSYMMGRDAFARSRRRNVEAAAASELSRV